MICRPETNTQKSTFQIVIKIRKCNKVIISGKWWMKQMKDERQCGIGTLSSVYQNHLEFAFKYFFFIIHGPKTSAKYGFPCDFYVMF